MIILYRGTTRFHEDLRPRLNYAR